MFHLTADSRLSTTFTRIIAGALAARFARRTSCVSPSIHKPPEVTPLRSNHVLVVPREEDHWLDLANDLTAHLMKVSCSTGRTI